MPTYTPAQERIIREIMRQTRGDPGRIRRSALMAGLVESNLRHVNYGDRDSLGFLQQRPSQGWGEYRPGMGGVRADLRDYLERARAAMQQGFRGGPGALAQHVQRSAFPDRYGERRPEVNAIMRAYGGGGPADPAAVVRGQSAAPLQPGGGNPLAMALLDRIGGGKDKPSIMDLVQAAQAGQAQPAPAAAPAAPGGGAAGGLKPGGGWGGSKGLASGLIQGLGLNVTSTKRDRQTTASGGVSDHWTGSKNAFAYDLGGSVSEMDRAAAKLARRLGIRYRPGQPLVATVNRNGYRIQVLYRTMTGGDHFDHVHVGVRRL